MKELNVGIIGLGFIGVSHLEAARRIPGVRVAGVADANPELAARRCEEYCVPACYESAEQMIADPSIQVIHNCTPNHLHAAINERIIRAGKHVFSEKPLGMSSAESGRMVELRKAHPQVVAGVNFCYRMNPLIQDLKNRIAAGELGRPMLVHGNYLQDWLLYDTDYNWRVESRFAGESRCVGDIGSHWMDLAQTVLGSRITAVCAQTLTAYPTRKKGEAAQTFSKAGGGAYTEVPVDTEDYAGALLRFENGAVGVFQCSQISAGHKCGLEIEVDGSLGSVKWEQETSDRMWEGRRDEPNRIVLRDPQAMTPGAARYAHLPAGHPEGWNDALKNNLQAFYTFIREGRSMGEHPCDFATFEEGHYLMRLTEAMLLSARKGGWVEL